jgi:hypothetical protein
MSIQLPGINERGLPGSEVRHFSELRPVNKLATSFGLENIKDFALRSRACYSIWALQPRGITDHDRCKTSIVLISPSCNNLYIQFKYVDLDNVTIIAGTRDPVWHASVIPVRLKLYGHLTVLTLLE